MDEGRSIQIWHEQLIVVSADIPQELPLATLLVDSHIHGGLRLQIGGRLVPWLGFFGPDDVCFNNWLEELWRVAHAFESSNDALHVFDEGEQGQPAFIFERNGDRAHFSIADAEFSGGTADPEWQQIEFSPAEFLAEYAHFRKSLFTAIREAAPTVADAWISRHDPAVALNSVAHAGSRT